MAELKRPDTDIMKISASHEVEVLIEWIEYLESDGLYSKIKSLFLQSETCGKCCPCPCRKTCPTEELYQEIREGIGMSQREDKCKDCSTCDKPEIELDGEES